MTTDAFGLRVLLDADDTSRPAVNSFRNNMRKANQEARNLTGFMNTAGKRANRQYLGGVQQIGYQVGDFATQVASGQNALIAFTQQGTQMISGFGPWGAVIGAAGAIVGALAVNLFRGGEGAESFEDAMEGWVDSLDGLEESVEQVMLPLDELREKYGEIDAAIRSALEAQVQFAVYQARQGFRTTFGQLASDENLDRLNPPIDPETVMGMQLFGGRIQELREALGLTEAEWDRLAEAMAGIKAAELTGSIEEQKAAVEEASQVMNELVDLSRDELPDGFRELGDNLAEALLEVRRMEKMIEEARDAGVTIMGGGGDSEVEGGAAGDRLTRSPRISSQGNYGVIFDPPGVSDGTRNSTIAGGYGAPGRRVPIPGGRAQVEEVREIDRTLESVVNRMERAVTQARSFDEAMRNVLASALEMAGTGLFGAGPLGDDFNDLFGVESGGIIGTLFNAKGNAFRGGRVTPFARGGVVSGATPFPMPGGVGVMGEAGPEAIMPLERGADGRLGVRSGGGQPHITVSMNITTPDAESFRRSRAQVASEMARAIGRAREF